MFESLLKAGASFDWIGPLLAFMQNYRNRPAVGYTVPLDYTWILELLKSKGIKLWGAVLVDEELVFCLRLAQAEYAQYWMEREGIPYRGGATKAEIADARKKPTSSDIIDKAFDSIDKLFDKI